VVSGDQFLNAPFIMGDFIKSSGTLNIKLGRLRPAQKNSFHHSILAFYAESDSVNNAYPWKSP